MDNIFVVADSAGANIAGLYLCLLNDPQYASDLGIVKPDGLKIKAAAFNCGCYDPLSFIQEKELMKGLVLEEKADVYDRLVNVTEHMNSSFPPVFLMSCVGDFCFRYFRPMSEALNRFGIEHTERIYGSEEEPLFHVFHLNIRNPQSVICNDEECDFFRKLWKPEMHF